jgi:hypothetical protein
MFATRQRSVFLLSKLAQQQQLRSRLPTATFSQTRFYSKQDLEEEEENRDKIVAKQVGGLPETQYKRRVFIHQPTRTAMQQGVSKHNRWRLEWERNTDFGGRWADPLMGWTATTDPLNSTYLFFDTKDAAIEYAERYGFDYTVEDAKDIENDVRPEKSYAAKFKYHPEDEEKW